MNHAKLRDNLVELIRRTSAHLPPDVENVIQLNRSLEKKDSMAAMALDIIMKNIGLAKKNSLPICQDTGTITFYVKAPVGMNQLQFRRAAEDAVVAATEKGYLRQNSVDSLTGKNTGNNLGKGSPVVYFEQWEKDVVDIRLILKGGGCENMSTQYALPTVIDGRRADRNLDGVRLCIMDAIVRAQGKGCAPGFLGVCIGGDRASGYSHAKKQLLREVDDVNPIPELARLEESILRDANELDVGPMGFGGKFTIGGCKIDYLNRLPASFYVSVSYMCWAFRRRGMVLDMEGNLKEWLYHHPGEFEVDYTRFPEPEIAAETARVLNLPVSEEAIRSLKVGDVVLLNGPLFTGRDAVHKYLFDGGELDILKGGVIYHCGPVVVREGETHRVVAAGPTTSIREEPYQHEIIRRFRIRAVIGKGGMGDRTLEACRKYGCVYLHAIGGAAQIYARTIIRVHGVYLEQFGSPEAVWHFEVRRFPAVVTMDSHGRSLHQSVAAHSRQQFLEKLKE